MTDERRHRHNLALRLLALYLLFIVPVLAVALFFDVQASQRLEDDVAAADLALAEAIALETDALLIKARQAVEAFARLPAVIDADVAGMAEAFNMGAIARQDINLFYRLDADGIMLFHHPVGPGSTVGTDFSFRDYFQQARTSIEAVFSKGRISPTTNRPVVTVVMPLWNAEGEFDGVVATNLELQRLTQTLVVIGQDPDRKGAATRGVQVTMVDASGQIVAHSQPEGRLLTAAPVLDVEQAPAEIARVLAGARGSVIARDPSSREWLYSYAPIPSAGWGVIVQRPTEIAFATARTFHRGLLFAIGVITLGAVLFWWRLSHLVIRPLEQLTSYSRLGSRGNVATRQVGPASGAEGFHDGSLAELARRDDQMGELARTLHRRLHGLEMLLETSTAVVSSLDTAQVLDSILEQVHRLLDVDTCAVLVLNPTGQHLEVRASRGLSEHYVQELRLDTSPRHLPAWRAIDSRQPVQVADVERDPTMAELLPLVRHEGYRALLAVPLTTRHGPPAVLIVYHITPHQFSTEEVQLAAAFGNQAAMALENASLYARTDEELQKQVRSLTILNQVMLTASQSLVLDDVLSNALDAVMELVQADLAVDYKAAWIYLLHEGEDTLLLRAQRGLSDQFVSAVGEIEVGMGPIGAVAASGQPLLLQDIGQVATSQDAHSSVQAAADEGLRALAAVPLRAKEVTVGVLGAATRTDRCFAQAEVDLLSAIGSQVGIAVENARLYQQTRQAAVLEERNRLAREIHDALAQGLTGIIVQLEAMERLAERRPEQALTSLQRAKDLARRSLQEARRSVSGLRPRSLEDMTLAEALRARVDTLGENGLHASFGTSGARRTLSPDVELNLFRIAQEALVNVQRHAQAEAVHVQLDYGRAHVRLIVDDDGIGLDAARDSESGEVQLESGTDAAALGFGLTGMKERATLLGGQIRVQSERDQGTRIEVIVPG